VAEAQGRLRADAVARGGRAHETADVDGRLVWRTAAVLVATIVGAGFVAYGLLALFHDETGRPLAPADARPTAMPSPPLSSTPVLDLKTLRAQKQAMLHEYAWIDRGKGIVRIPIEQAMSLLIARSHGPK